VLSEARACVGVVLRGKYRLDRLLGVGGMACVYAATHLHNADRVAVKILHRELSVDAGLRARFLREGDAANRVQHPGTVRVLDDDIAEDGRFFIVMDLLDGETLSARWERSGRRLGAREVVMLVCEVLDVLSAAHAKGIVHRDLKPENLFLTRDGKVKVLDFGLARSCEGSPSWTKTGAVFGTPAFMAPEQALGRTSEVDALSDLWALGATAFLLLTGRLVHQGRTPEETMVLSATQSAPTIAAVVHDVPPVVAKIIDRALAFDKAARWPSAQAMRHALLQSSRIVWTGDAPDDLEDEHDPRMASAPASQMTLPSDVMPSMQFRSEEDTLELPTLPAASMVAAVLSRSQPDRAWRRFPVVRVVCGLGIATVVAAIVAAPNSSKHHTPTVSGPVATSLPASAGPVRTSSAVIANAPAVEPSTVDVETLPLAPFNPSINHR